MRYDGACTIVTYDLMEEPSGMALPEGSSGVGQAFESTDRAPEDRGVSGLLDHPFRPRETFHQSPVATGFDHSSTPSSLKASRTSQVPKRR